MINWEDNSANQSEKIEFAIDSMAKKLNKNRMKLRMDQLEGSRLKTKEY